MNGTAKGLTFLGYRREDGRVGVRNHVAVIPLDGLANNAAQGVTKIIHGTVALAHPYGDLQFGRDLELFFKTLAGCGANPNVAAAVVIGAEPDWTDRLAEGIARTGKPVEAFAIERHGDLRTIERAARKAAEFVRYATGLQRQQADLSEIVVGIKCSESDPTSGLAASPVLGRAVERLLAAGATVMFGETSELTGAEHVVAARFKSREQQEKFWRCYNEYVGFIAGEKAHLLGSQPTQGNIRGGLSTIEEKAFGNIQKIGQALIEGVLEPAEAPPAKGLWFMNTSSAAAEVLTLFSAAGAVLQIVTTGQGNVAGNPVTPVIKMCANPRTVAAMSEHIDVDVSALLRQQMTREQAADLLLDALAATLNGRLTGAEILGHREFVPTRLHRSA